MCPLLYRELIRPTTAQTFSLSEKWSFPVVIESEKFRSPYNLSTELARNDACFQQNHDSILSSLSKPTFLQSSLTDGRFYLENTHILLECSWVGLHLELTLGYPSIFMNWWEKVLVCWTPRHTNQCRNKPCFQMIIHIYIWNFATFKLSYINPQWFCEGIHSKMLKSICQLICFQMDLGWNHSFLKDNGKYFKVSNYFHSNSIICTAVVQKTPTRIKVPLCSTLSIHKERSQSLSPKIDNLKEKM